VRRVFGVVLLGFGLASLMTGGVCETELHLIPRDEAIPGDAVKMTPETDTFPPVLHSSEFEDPVPMPGPVNTAGAEDAPVISRDGSWFFFAFVPDVHVPPEKQLIDGATGTYWSRRTGKGWTEPERLVLNDDVSLDGPMCIRGFELWFASVRAGNYRQHGDLYVAEYAGGEWGNWLNAGERLNAQDSVGENYLTPDGSRMLFHRLGFGGHGGYDLWEMEWVDGDWGQPVNLGPVVNDERYEGMPWVSRDGNEVWFNRTSSEGYPGPALYRTFRTDSGWTTPEEIVSSFAGDPGLDDEGNLYFVHHYYTGTDPIQMIEADIYVCYRRK